MMPLLGQGKVWLRRRLGWDFDPAATHDLVLLVTRELRGFVQHFPCLRY